ncbi:hypothetical protein N9195_03075 [bacterium]|nr:hypothetical protein [bacterium]
MTSNPSLEPAVISTKQAHGYVGGKPCWDELRQAYPEILKPVRKTPQGWEYWLTSTIQLTLQAAQVDGKLVH